MTLWSPWIFDVQVESQSPYQVSQSFAECSIIDQLRPRIDPSTGPRSISIPFHSIPGIHLHLLLYLLPLFNLSWCWRSKLKSDLEDECNFRGFQDQNELLLLNSPSPTHSFTVSSIPTQTARCVRALPLDCALQIDTFRLGKVIKRRANSAWLLPHHLQVLPLLCVWIVQLTQIPFGWRGRAGGILDRRACEVATLIRRGGAERRKWWKEDFQSKSFHDKKQKKKKNENGKLSQF